MFKKIFWVFWLLSGFLTVANAFDGGLVSDNDDNLCSACIQPKSSSHHYFPNDEVGASVGDLSKFKADLEGEIVHTLEKEQSYSGGSKKN